MTVKKKATKPKYSASADEIINRGGKTSADVAEYVITEDEVRFTLRLQKKIIQKIDKDRKNKAGNVSRNQWIVEAIANHLG